MKTRTVICRWDEHARSVAIQVEYEGIRKDFAQVMQSISLSTFEPEKPVVSWCAMGSVSPQIASVASRALEEAVRVAHEFAQISEWKRVTPPIECSRWMGPGMPPVIIEGGRIEVPTEGWEVFSECAKPRRLAQE